MKYRRKYRKKPYEWKLKKWVVLVGLPGSGKSALGCSIAQRLAVPFFDADTEIVRSANMEVSEIFSEYGESEFRRLEEQVIARILQTSPAILALGGGAFENEHTRQNVSEAGLSVWLNVDHDVILGRVAHRAGRPLFDNADDPQAVLRELALKREKNYAKADLTFVPPEASLDVASRALVSVLRKYAMLKRVSRWKN